MASFHCEAVHYLSVFLSEIWHLETKRKCRLGILQRFFGGKGEGRLNGIKSSRKVNSPYLDHSFKDGVSRVP